MEALSVPNVSATIGQLVDKVSQNNDDAENAQVATPLISGPDTVEISDEGRDMAQTVQATATSGNSASNATTTESNSTNSTEQSKATAGSAKGASAGGSASGASGDNSSSEDTITKLEKQIKELQQEIADLATKALSDDNAKKELEAKQTELAALTAELAQLQNQQKS